MKRIGNALFGVGFLASAFFLVQRLDDIEWGAFAASVAVCAAGVAVMRWARWTDDAARQAMRADVTRARESLDEVVRVIGGLNAQREVLGVYRISRALDDRLSGPLTAFVQAREAIERQYGADRYADVMDPFATGERALNRAWSASVDGYIDEVWPCLDRAERSMARALRALDSAMASADQSEDRSRVA